MGFYIGIHTVLTADAVASGEVSGYNFVLRHCSFPRFADAISQGYIAQLSDPWLARLSIAGFGLFNCESIPPQQNRTKIATTYAWVVGAIPLRITDTSKLVS